MKNIFLTVFLIVASVLIVRVLIPPQSMIGQEPKDQTNLVFQNPLKSEHWVNNTPQHASSFAAPPRNVVIDVDLELAPPSEISIKKDDKEYGIGPTLIDPNGLAMRRNMDEAAPGGIYTVIYKPCWEDGQCHKGSFEFSIDRRLADNFEDHRGRADIPPDIHIAIENGTFAPKKIRIRKNTRVIWTNNDSVDHSVTTDTYPTNSYFPLQSSATIKPKGAFEVVFSDPGEYPYHSDDNSEVMVGSVLVE